MNIPVLGQPELLGMIVVTTIRCSCERRTILMAQVAQVIQCPNCKKAWITKAKVSGEIQQVFLEDNKQEMASLSES